MGSERSRPNICQSKLNHLRVASVGCKMRRGGHMEILPFYCVKVEHIDDTQPARPRKFIARLTNKWTRVLKIIKNIINGSHLPFKNHTNAGNGSEKLIIKK